jgi:AbrB family looped-hinge helix DNA binding protein
MRIPRSGSCLFYYTNFSAIQSVSAFFLRVFARSGQRITPLTANVLPLSYLGGIPMAQATTRSTVVSTKGQVILPQAIRKRRQWSAGTRLIVEDTPEGVLLKAAPFFLPSKPEEVFGSLHTGEPAKSLKEMDDAITMEIKRRHARGRY